MNHKEDKKSFLVIGGTGFIGSNLIRYLLRNNHRVTVYHRQGSDLKNLKGLSFDSVLGDLTDKEGTERALSNVIGHCDAIFNLAVCDVPLKRYFSLMQAVNVEAVSVIVHLVKAANGLRLIHVSSSTAVGYPEYGEIIDENFIFNAHNDPYALSKHIGEDIVLREAGHGLDAVVAIPCSTIGSYGMKNHQLNMIKNIAKGSMRVFPAGGLCLTNVNDLVKGLYQCYEKGIKGKRYILGGHNITYKQYFEEIASATGGRAPRIKLPKLIMPWLGLCVEVFYGFLKKDTNMSRHVARLISNNLYYSSELAIRELGYSITDWKGTIYDVVGQLKSTNKIS